VQSVEVSLRLARTYLDAGDEAGGAQVLDAIAADDPWEWRVWWYRGLMALASGDPARAVALLVEIDRTPHIRESPSYPPYVGDMVRVAVAAGDRELAERLARGVEPVYPYHEHALAGARAILLEASGDLHGAAEAYRDAAARWERFGVVPERAHALWGQGRCLLEMGRSSEAAEPLREARASFANLGAGPAVAAVDELLERLSAPSL